MGKKQKTVPPTRPGLRTIPLSPKDQFTPIYNVRILDFFIVRSCLDEQLLRDALDRLIRRHLRILGARVEPTGKDGWLEYHLHDEFPADYKLFEWSSSVVCATFDGGCIELDRKPEANDHGGVVFGPPIHVQEEKWRPATWPLERKHEKPDTPTLLVHLTKYYDATVVAVNIPHAVADQMGVGSLVEAWLCVARGEEPQPFLELLGGELDGPSDLSEEELRRKYEYRLLTKSERFWKVFGLAMEVIKEKQEIRKLMFLPDALVQNLRHDFNEEIASMGQAGSPTLSNGDVIAAILHKLGQLHRKSPRNFMLNGSLTVRGRHAALPEGEPYLHNAIAFSAVNVPCGRDTPLFDIARKNRASVEEALKPANIERSLAVTTKMSREGWMIGICEPGDLSYAVTNWCGAWRNLNFAPAVARSDIPVSGRVPSPQLPERQAGPPLIVLGHALERSIDVVRFNSQIMSRGEGGYWVDWGCAAKNMVFVEELLKRDPKLETIKFARDMAVVEKRKSLLPLESVAFYLVAAAVVVAFFFPQFVRAATPPAWS